MSQVWVTCFEWRKGTACPNGVRTTEVSPRQRQTHTWLETFEEMRHVMGEPDVILPVRPSIFFFFSKPWRRHWHRRLSGYFQFFFEFPPFHFAAFQATRPIRLFSGTRKTNPQAHSPQIAPGAENPKCIFSVVMSSFLSFFVVLSPQRLQIYENALHPSRA